MLVLARKKDEAILINHDIEIVIVEISGDKVKLGIKAPADIPIYRKEVYLEIQAENREAVEAPDVLIKQLNKIKLPGEEQKRD